MSKLIVGEIKPNINKELWYSASDGYAELIDDVIVNRECSIGVLDTATELFNDQIQPDWVSFAWRARRKQIQKLFKRKGYKEDLTSLDGRKLYAVIYVG